jgi:hypothetical protein
MPIPHITDIDQMKDSDLLYAADLKGKTLTVEITDINARDFQDDDEKAKKMYLLDLKGTAKKLCVNRTNQLLLSKMFGRNPNGWIGKRIGIHPMTTRMGGETVPCIRIYGSPEIDQDIEVKAKLARSTVKKTLKAMKVAPKQETQPKPAQNRAADLPLEDVDPNILEAWTILGYSREEGQKDMSSYKGVDYLGHLSAFIDQKLAEEAL